MPTTVRAGPFSLLPVKPDTVRRPKQLHYFQRQSFEGLMFKVRNNGADSYISILAIHLV